MRMSRPFLLRRSGGVIFWLVICLMVMLTIVALTLDGGRMVDERRSVQAASDAAALAAAAHLRSGYCFEPNLFDGAKKAALRIAAANGYDDKDQNTKITVNNPPKSGPFTGDSRHVEVIIETVVSGSFSRVLTQQPLHVRARAVAESLRRELGLLTLKKDGKRVFFVHGTVAVDLTGSPVIVNSAEPDAYQIDGNSTVIAEYHGIVGGLKATLGARVIGPIKKLAAQDVIDVLHCLKLPDISLLPIQSANPLQINSGSRTLKPGTYVGGISITGNAQVVMEAGTYIMKGGGFDYKSAGDLIGDGVTIINFPSAIGGGINLTGTGRLSVSAPKTGTFAGIALFQPLELTETVRITGYPTTKIDGVIYAPKGAVKLQAQGTDFTTLLGGGYVTHTLEISGNGSFRIGAALKTPSASSLRLVE